MRHYDGPNLRHLSTEASRIRQPCLAQHLRFGVVAYKVTQLVRGYIEAQSLVQVPDKLTGLPRC